MVEKRWRSACKDENDGSVEDGFNYSVLPYLPTDSEIAVAVAGRKNR